MFYLILNSKLNYYEGDKKMKLIHVIIIVFCIIAAFIIVSIIVIKFAPKKLHKKILIRIWVGLFIIIILSILGTLGVLNIIPTRLNAQQQSAPKQYISKNHIGNALIVYQPAWTDITKNAAYALAESLKEKGYSVTVNYPGSFLPKDTSNYDILAFGTPIYNSKGSNLITNYLKSIKSLNGKKVILFTTGSTTPLKYDKAYTGIKNYMKNVSKVQRIKFSNKTNDKKFADKTVNSLCEK